MLVIVTVWVAAPVVGKYEQMGFSGSVLCWQRWRKIRDVAKTGFMCSRSVVSMVDVSPLKLFFCVSRKRMTS